MHVYLFVAFFRALCLLVHPLRPSPRFRLTPDCSLPRAFLRLYPHLPHQPSVASVTDLSGRWDRGAPQAGGGGGAGPPALASTMMHPAYYSRLWWRSGGRSSGGSGVWSGEGDGGPEEEGTVPPDRDEEAGGGGGGGGAESDDEDSYGQPGPHLDGRWSRARRGSYTEVGGEGG